MTTTQADRLDQPAIDAHLVRVESVVDSEGGGGATTSCSTSKYLTSLADPVLGLAAEVLDDLERTRIANENRLRQLTGRDVDKDGIGRQRGYDPLDKDVVAMTALVDALGAAEHQAVLNLQRIVRRHPLGQWGKEVRGIGEKQLARLLAVIGDPYMRELVVDDQITMQPRTVSQLWAYCGYNVTDDGRAVRRTRGQQANWSTVAKTRSYLIAEACMKAGDNPYRAAYDTRKASTDGRLHRTECVRCGPAGKPAQPGSPWSDGHRHNDALRIAAKTLLRDLWREGRRLHEQ